MQIINCASGEEVSAVPDGAVFLLGYFDGVHLGHRSLIDRAAEYAEGKKNVAAWMFGCLPKGDVLTDNAEKCALLGEYGVDYAVFEEFDSLKDLDGRTFFDDIIVRRYHPSAVVCGYNFRFGRRAAWSSDDLCRFAEEAGIGCAVVPHFEKDGCPVSSTAIRSLIAAGRVDEAAELLGRSYSVTLPVVHGHRIGRTIGHPTINQIIPPGRISPARGVYSCMVSFTDKDGVRRLCGGVCNIGSRPTVNRDTADVTLETYIFDYSGDLYNLSVKTSFCEKLRDETKFSSVEELAEQITRDGERARESLTKRYTNDFCKV
ncbi:MAG: riboflavin biosynthesis protein RibF [Clostridia bacterium]|nr:riboflavin biosynthesis protein RibF [Clostridia bacterium]